MSDTLNLPYVRFVRQYNTEPAVNTAYLATLARAVEGLKATAWREAAPGVTVGMPLSNPLLSFTSDAYDTFKSSGDAAAKSGKQAAYVGMAAYRYTLPADAFSGTSAKAVSVTFQAYSDKFNWRGLLVCAYLSDSANPPSDWSVMAAGDVATQIDESGNGILPDAAPATSAATNKSGSFTLEWGVAAEPKTYLYVILQHAAWTACRWEYWIEGAGMLDGATLAVTFSRDVAPDTEAQDSIRIAAGGAVVAPVPDDSPTCAVAFRGLPVGSSQLPGVPAPSSALAALPSLFARLAAQGAEQLSFASPPSTQSGLACTITRRISGATAPFSQRLEYLSSAVAVLACFPNSYVPRRMTLSHRAGLDPVLTSGASVLISAYWVAGKELSLSEAGQLSSSPEAQFADGKVTVGDMTATRVGSAGLPPSIAGGDSVSILLSGMNGRWGTMILVASIDRVTAAGLDVEVPVGLLGLTLNTDSTLSGSGWMPDIVISKQ